MKLFDRFFKKEPIIAFKSFVGNFSVNVPVVAASKVRTEWMKNQTEPHKFTTCPGMLDYHMTGYIITAYTDLHIKANKAGVIVIPEPFAILTDMERDLMKPAPFEYKIVEGMVPFKDNVFKNVNKVPMPWAVFTKRGYSAYVLPVLMHPEFADRIFIYPGVVDYDQFHSLSLIFSVTKECEFVIPAGTPLLHVIPFKREKIIAECGKTTDIEREKQFFSVPSRAVKNYYRRFLSERKSFKMKCPYEHPQYKDKK